jgi:hypothetical protein
MEDSVRRHLGTFSDILADYKRPPIPEKDYEKVKEQIDMEKLFLSDSLKVKQQPQQKRLETSEESNLKDAKR